MIGQPVARLARIRVDASTRGHHGRYAGRLGQRVLEGLDPLARQRGRAGRARGLVEPLGGRAQVGLQTGPVGLLGVDPPGDLLAQLGHPLAGLGAGGEHRHVGEAVGVEQPSDVGEHRLAAVGRHGVDVVEHHEHHVAMAGERGQVAVVDGRVGVLLRVEHPHQQVGELHEPVDLEVVGDLGGVVVGQVEQHQASDGVVVVAVVEHRVAQHLVSRRDAEPVEQLGGAVAAPDARGGPRRRGAAYADGRQLAGRSAR